MGEMTRDEIVALAIEVAKVMPTKPDPQLYRAKTVAQKMDVTVTTVWRYVDSGRLPQPIDLSEGCKVWDAQVINDYIASLTAQAVCNA